MEMKNNSKTAAVASYITWIGFLIALVIRDPSDGYVAHHMNQALVLNIAAVVGSVLSMIPVLGSIASGIISLATFILCIMGIYRAATGSTKPLPLIGDFHLIG